MQKIVKYFSWVPCWDKMSWQNTMKLATVKTVDIYFIRPFFLKKFLKPKSGSRFVPFGWSWHVSFQKNWTKFFNKILKKSRHNFGYKFQTCYKVTKNTSLLYRTMKTMIAGVEEALKWKNKIVKRCKKSLQISASSKTPFSSLVLDDWTDVGPICVTKSPQKETG